ncbi:hypothetical protein chiPu_0013061 [Chiloscyllium punctatum]|uniref:Uncharacterized protein n=1 Tax=Chiloscyllium punctatum TaxID=137246 RepID=A0A401SW54_CHIPU|nr:hypothetical protein [Chiloscyllium punctatum]
MIDAFYNAWLEVLPGVQTLCLFCTSERDPRPTCLRHPEVMDLGGCMFGTMCAMPEDFASAPAFDAITLRELRDIVNDALTGLNTGTSVVNSLDIQGLNERIEQLKRVMRDLLQRSLTNQADQAFLGEEGAYIQLDDIAVLEKHAHIINRLIDRERENTAHIHEGQLCHAYDLWMVAQIRHNHDQLQREEVPDWIDSAKLA